MQVYAPDDGQNRPVEQFPPHHTHGPRSSLLDRRPPTHENWVQNTTCCNTRSNAPDDGRKRPKHVELKEHQCNYFVASSWFFTNYWVRENVFNFFSGKAFLRTYELLSYGNTHYVTNAFLYAIKIAAL
jgi:hypothetical protein